MGTTTTKECYFINITFDSGHQRDAWDFVWKDKGWADDERLTGMKLNSYMKRHIWGQNKTSCVVNLESMDFDNLIIAILP